MISKNWKAAINDDIDDLSRYFLVKKKSNLNIYHNIFFKVYGYLRTKAIREKIAYYRRRSIISKEHYNWIFVKGLSKKSGKWRLPWPRKIRNLRRSSRVHYKIILAAARPWPRPKDRRFRGLSQKLFITPSSLPTWVRQ